MSRPALTRLSSQHQITVPEGACDALGLKSGDFLEATIIRGGVLLRPKVVRNRDEFLRQLKKDIEASKAAVKAGRYLGPFDSADDAARACKQFQKQRRAHARRSA